MKQDSILQHNLSIIRNQIVNYTLVFASIFGLVVYAISLQKAFTSGLMMSHVTDFIAVFGIFLLTIFRKKVSVKIKALVILTALFLIILIDLLYLGLLSANKVFIVIIPFYALTVYSYRRTVFILSLVLFAFAIIGISVITDTNPFLTDLENQIYTVRAWAINFAELFIVAFIILVMTNRFNQTYENVYEELERKRDYIAERERNYREIFDYSTDAIFIHNMDGDIVDVNESMLNMYGYKKEEISKVHFNDLCSGESPYNFGHAAMKISKAITEGEQVFDWHAKKKNGELFWVEVALKYTSIAGKERVLAVVRDINEKKEIQIQLEEYRIHLEKLVQERTKQLENINEELVSTNDDLVQQKEELLLTLEKLRATQEQLIQSEKMATVGVLTAGVAHEINNPLNFIQGGLYGLDSYLQRNKSSEEFFQNKEDIILLRNAMKDGVDRVKTIVNGLNYFNRQTNSYEEECNPHEIIENCLNILKSQINSNIEIQKNFTKDAFLLKGNEGKLHQAFVNVIINSIHAIKENGSIKIDTKIEDNLFILCVEDNGHGIPEDIMHKIFDPFFTTKDAGKGTGLGLSIAYGIITEHNGTLAYESEVDKGTLAIIKLPIT